MLGSTLKIKEITVDLFESFIRKELAATISLGTFKGTRNSCPERDNDAQLMLFNEKQNSLSVMLSNMGLFSKHFFRRVKQGDSHQHALHARQHGAPGPSTAWHPQPQAAPQQGGQHEQGDAAIPLPDAPQEQEAPHQRELGKL